MAAESPDLSQAHQGLLRDFLRRSDQVKFARYLPAADYIANRPKSVRGEDSEGGYRNLGWCLTCSDELSGEPFSSSMGSSHEHYILSTTVKQYIIDRHPDRSRSDSPCVR